jgi:hypothetical protein
MKQLRRALLIVATLASTVAITAPTVEAGTLTASATKFEYNRTRAVTHSSDTEWKASCWYCISAHTRWKNGSAALKSLPAPKSTAAAKTPARSEITPIASTNGGSVSMSFSFSGAGVSAGTTSNSCSAGTYGAAGGSVSVTMSGVWCDAYSMIGAFWDTKVRVNAATLYGASTWSRFAASS